MNPDVIDSLPTPSDPTLAGMLDETNLTYNSSENPPTFTNDQTVSSSPSLGSIIQSIGNDVLGVVGIERGTGTVRTPSAIYQPSGVSVSTGVTTNFLVLGVIAFVAIMAFRH